MAYDVSPDVQLQVAIASRKVNELDALPVLVNVAASCGSDTLIPSIVWPNLHPLLEADSARFIELFAQCDLQNAPGLAKIAPRIVERMLDNGGGQYADVGELLYLTARQDATCARQCLAQLAESMKQINDEQQTQLASAIGPKLSMIQQQAVSAELAQASRLIAARLGVGNTSGAGAREIWLDGKQPTPVRLQVLDVLISLKDEALPATLPSILQTEDAELLTQVLPELGRLDDPALGELLLNHYPHAVPELRPLIVDVLMQREIWASQLLAQIEARKLPRDALHAGHLRKIMETNDRDAIWLVEDIWGQIRTDRDPDREQVVSATLEMLSQTEGDPRAGEHVFHRICAQCHQLHGHGYAVGPDLSDNGRGSFQQLVTSVLDPNLLIGRGYQTVMAITDDGRNLTGIPVEDNEKRLVLRLPGGKTHSIPRNSIMFAKQQPLSMMPEGIEQSLSEQELADLFAYLSLDKHPDAPDAQRIPGAPTHDD
jgi:putative heme-binding domain-containing protein